MTFESNETSLEGGAPVELYEFIQGGDVFRFASSEDNQLIGANLFSAATIQRSEIVISSEARGSMIKLTMPTSNEFAQRYIGVQPGSRASLTITRFHRFDTPTPEVETIFQGQVRSVAFTNQGINSEIAVMPLTVALNRQIPRFAYSNLCNHVLYDARCKVLESAFTFTAVVSNVSADGQTLTIPGLDVAKGVGFATGGFVEIPSTNDFRLILEHTATDQIKILLPFRTSPLSVSVDVKAGCDHSLPICKSKFNNVINYGGFAFVPEKDIFKNGLT